MTLASPNIPADNIHAHILLMRAIHNLQQDIQPGEILFDPQTSETRLRFLERAVHRFGAWINSRKGSARLPLSSVEEVPPLDVLMVWHTYMLSPTAYYDDSLKILPALASLGGMPWALVASCIDDKTWTFKHNLAQIMHWEKATSLPFNLEASKETPNDAKLPQISVDLVKAVLRQSFSLNNMLAAVDKFEELGCAQWITQASSRYDEYMRLPVGGYVPPLDVDIIWHTHQLSGTKYRDESLKCFGRFIGHYDSHPPAEIIKGRQLTRSVLTADTTGAGVDQRDCAEGCNGDPPGPTTVFVTAN